MTLEEKLRDSIVQAAIAWSEDPSFTAILELREAIEAFHDGRKQGFKSDCGYSGRMIRRGAHVLHTRDGTPPEEGRRKIIAEILATGCSLSTAVSRFVGERTVIDGDPRGVDPGLTFR